MAWARGISKMAIASTADIATPLPAPLSHTGTPRNGPLGTQPYPTPSPGKPQSSTPFASCAEVTKLRKRICNAPLHRPTFPQIKTERQYVQKKNWLGM